MKHAFITRTQRPKVISGGILVSIDKKHLEWLFKFLMKNKEILSLRKLTCNLPDVKAIEVVDGNNQISLIVISPKSGKGQFQIDHYTGDNLEADFSLFMLIDNKGITFKDLTRGVRKEQLKQVSDFVISILFYEYLVKPERRAKKDTIIPFQVFGKSLV